MKNRIISGIVLVGIFIGAFLSNDIVWTVLMTLISLLALKELIEVKYKNSFNIINILSSLFLMLIIINGNYFSISNMIIISGLIIALLSPIVFIESYNIEDAIYYMGIVCFLGFVFNSLIFFRIENIKYCILIFGLSSITDTYALIGGSLIGKHKLTSVSPKKTWEGSIIGSLVGTFIGTIFYLNFISNENIIYAIIISFVLTIFCEVGDLIFSSIKRHFNIKDFSNMIPGHGGILDRFDSIIFVTIGLVLILNIL